MASQAEKAFSIRKPVRIDAALRRELEDAIRGRLTAVDMPTAVLDNADGDENREPYLGTSQFGGRPQDIDREAEVGDEGEMQRCETHGKGDTSASLPDHEPSLAHTNDLNQERSAASAL